MISQVKNLIFWGRKKETIVTTEAAEQSVSGFSVEEELKRYLEPVSLPQDNLLAKALEQYAKEVKRFSKEQYKVTTQLEELLIQVEEQTEKELANTLLEEKVKATTDEVQQLLKNLIISCDALEEVYRFAQQTDNPWQEQLQLQWQRLGQALTLCGLARVEGLGESYSAQTQIALGLDSDLALPENVVLAIVKSGYFYRGKLFRKAEVIVNKHKPEEAAAQESIENDFLLD